MTTFSKLYFTLLIFFCAFRASTQTATVSEQFCDAIILRYQPTINAMTGKGWDHANSILLDGMAKIYGQTQKTEYLDYIKDFVDTHVDDQGRIEGLKSELDGIHPGMLCLFLYETTGEDKYKTAAGNMRDFLLGTAENPSIFNTTPDGGFWHKNNDHYKQVMTIDGAYMSNPFLVKYGVLFDDKQSIEEAVFQTLLVASRTLNIQNMLPYHGWCATKDKSWSHPITGTFSEVWSRSIGWFLMALVDMLELLPEEHPDYSTLLNLYVNVIEGISALQNSDGLWYQMVGKPESPGNYPETSGTAMITYAIQKAVNLNLLEERYGDVADKAWSGIRLFIKEHSDGLPSITSFCPGMGIQDTFEDYLKVRPVSCPSDDSKQHAHGYIGVLMAGSVMEY